MVSKIVQKIGLLENGDTKINERLCLIINGFMMLTEHRNAYNFLGGNVPLDFLSKNIGTTSLKELREELGMIVDEQDITIKLLSWIGTTKLLTLLIIKDVKSIKFIKSTHVWESNSFTLIPVLESTNITMDELGKYIEKMIRDANKQRVTHIKYDSDGQISGTTIDQVSSIDQRLYVQKHDIDNSYTIKLGKRFVLDYQEKEYLRYLNGKINGYSDTKYVFSGDYKHNFKYISSENKIRIWYSKKYLNNMGAYNEMNYNNFINSNPNILEKKQDVLIKTIVQHFI